MRSIITILTLAVTAPLTAQSADSLSGPIQLRAGDYAAWTLTSWLPAFHNHALDNWGRRLASTVIALYDTQTDLVEVQVYGDPRSAEAAKEVVDRYWQLIKEYHMPYAATRISGFGEHSYRLTYWDQDAGRAVISYHRGSWTLP